MALVAATYDYDWKVAERRYARIMVDGAVSPWTRVLCANFYLLPAGRFEDAVKQCELALQDDPIHLATRLILAICLDAAGQIAEAEAPIRQTLELDPNFAPAYHAAAAHYASRGRFAEALAFAEKGFSLGPGIVHAIGPVAGLLSRTGNQTRAEELLELGGGGLGREGD